MYFTWDLPTPAGPTISASSPVYKPPSSSSSKLQCKIQKQRILWDAVQCIFQLLLITAALLSNNL